MAIHTQRYRWRTKVAPIHPQQYRCRSIHRRILCPFHSFGNLRDDLSTAGSTALRIFQTRIPSNADGVLPSRSDVHRWSQPASYTIYRRRSKNRPFSFRCIYRPKLQLPSDRVGCQVVPIYPRTGLTSGGNRVQQRYSPRAASFFAVLYTIYLARTGRASHRA